MNLKNILAEKNMTIYKLSQISGVPKTTVTDICSGKSDIQRCSAITVYQIAKALCCQMEDLMQIDTANYDKDTGLPKDESYLEKCLPENLKKSITSM